MIGHRASCQFFVIRVEHAHVTCDPLPRARPRASVILLTVQTSFFALPALLAASRSKRVASVEVLGLGLCAMMLSLGR